MRMLTSRWTLLGAGLVVAAVTALAITTVRDSRVRAPTSEAGVEQSNEGGGITVRGIYVTASHLASLPSSPAGQIDLDRQAAIHLVLDTHQGDLRGYGYRQNAAVSTSGKDSEPSGWIVLDGDAHHLEGLLVFDLPPREGELRLTLRNLGGVAERMFLWQTAP